MNALYRIALFLTALPSFACSEMTLEEKVGQCLMVHFNGKEVNSDARTLIQTVHAGGFIYYNWANGLDGPDQVRSLSRGLQQMASIPLLIAADQEGGLVSRLNDGFTIFPGNMALGKTNDPGLAKAAAYAAGQELLAVGVNMNLAPVVDVNSNPRNPIIGIRSFSDCPQTVSIFARKSIEGYHRAGIITSLKHFPGHGDVEIDSHENLPVVNKSIAALNQQELLPFFELSDLADTVMTAHIMVPSLDPKNCATLSPAILSLLRDQMGFDGVIISDSLVMEGVLKNCNHSVEEAAIRAFNAGCDILMLGGRHLHGTSRGFELTVGDVQRIHQKIIDAVRSKRISEDRLNESVDRIIRLKNRYELSSGKELTHPAAGFDQQTLVKQIAALALQTIRNESIPSIKESRIALFAPELVRKAIVQTSLATLGKTIAAQFFTTLNPGQDETVAAQNLVKDADIIIFCSYNAWKNSAQASLIDLLKNTKKPMVLISLRDPIDASLFPDIALIISTFSPTAPSIQAAADLLDMP